MTTDVCDGKCHYSKEHGWFFDPDCPLHGIPYRASRYEATLGPDPGAPSPDKTQRIGVEQGRSLVILTLVYYRNLRLWGKWL